MLSNGYQSVLTHEPFDCLFEAISTRLSPHEAAEIKPFVSKLPTACSHRLRAARVLLMSDNLFDRDFVEK